MAQTVKDKKFIRSGNDAYSEIVIDDDGAIIYLTAEWENSTKEIYYSASLSSILDLCKKVSSGEISEEQYDEEVSRIYGHEMLDKAFVLKRYSSHIFTLTELLGEALYGIDIDSLTAS